MSKLNPTEHAESLLKQYGYQGALDHANFVLTPEFGLSKAYLKEFWVEVKKKILESCQ